MIVLFLVNRAEAHGLHASHQVLAGQKIQIQAWYDGNEPASGATVEVRRPDGSLVAEGRLDADGLWVFPVPDRAELRVVVRDGGHLARLTIAAGELAAPLPWRDVL